MVRAWPIFWTSLTLIFIAAILLWSAGSAMTGPINRRVAVSDHHVQPTTIVSSGGVTLAANYWPAPATADAVLLLHGNGASRADMDSNAAWLSDQGYAVLAIDFRGHGESSATERSFGLFEAQDAHAAMAWLAARHPHSKHAVIGFSLGGAAALLGEQGPVPADAYVIECTYPDIRTAIHNRIAMRLGWLAATILEPLLSYQSLPRYGVWPDAISPINAMRTLRAPALVVGGGADMHSPPSESRAMAAAAPQGELLILDGLSHDEVVSTTSPVYRERLLAFLNSAPSPSSVAQ